MKIDEMNIDEIKKLFSLRTLYGIPLRVSADAPDDYIAVSPEVMRMIQGRGSTLQSPWMASDDRRMSDDMVSTMEHAHHSH